MPRHISFALTTKQFLDGTKTVTRRLGWANVKAGEVLTAVEKSQGLGKGGKVRQLGTIRIVAARRERLGRLTEDLVYGRMETALEGFPLPHRLSDPFKFIQFFRESHRGCSATDDVTRIEFEKIEDGS